MPPSSSTRHIYLNFNNVVLEGGSYVRCDQSSLAFIPFYCVYCRNVKEESKRQKTILGNLDVNEKIKYSVIIKIGIVKV